MSLYYNILQAFKAAGRVDDHAYFPQFRLEGRARDVDNEDSLAMRTADPLWMLGRQWQFGEFVGEDNGSPVRVVADYHALQTDRYATNDMAAALNNRPLEVAVEAMLVSPLGLHLRSRIKIGEQFKRIIRRLHPGKNEASELIKTLQEKYSIDQQEDSDTAAKRLAQLTGSHAIDGGKILIDFDNRADKPLKRPPELDSLDDAAQELLNWFTASYEQPLYVKPDEDKEAQNLSAWNAEKLAHDFSVGVGESGPALLAPDYQSGHLDWYSFDSANLDDFTLPIIPKSAPDHFPINLSFPGMPHKRLFAFEDKQVDLGDMDINDDDLIRIMLVDFSLYSGSDWYIIPFAMQVGAMAWIDRVKVTDVFGVETSIQNGNNVGPSLSIDKNEDGKLTGLDVWDVFKIRDENVTEYKAEQHFLYLAPAAHRRQESEPVEEVLYLRDEFANMVWGIEKRLPDELGYPVDGYDLHLDRNGPFVPTGSGDRPDPENRPRYRLSSTVPFNWIPYVPKPGKPGYLRRAYIVDQEQKDVKPISHLARQDLMNIREEAIPKAGIRVQLTKQRTRWTDGKTYVWLGRKVVAGRGEGDSGLRFDYLGREKK